MAEKCQISGAVNMSPGNTVQPVVKSIQGACVEQPYPVTVHTETRGHPSGSAETHELTAKALAPAANVSC